MEQSEFAKYIPILQQRPFELYPDLKRKDINGQNSFRYVDDNHTHVRIQNINGEYLLPLVLIEFVNPGVMRLYRKVRTYGDSFV